MKIISLEVSGFNRLALSDSKYYKLDPNNIHLILGTNGSGKSSLMELMTPLPPNRKDFTEDGWKRIIIEHNGNRYDITNSGGKHTMLVNNVPIVENAGLKTMIALVYEHFNITPNTHKVMLGKVSMINMPLQARKDFISAISNVDFTYANNLYSGLKKKLRDEQAIVKYMSDKITELKEFIIAEDDIVKLTKDKEDILRVVYNLYESKKEIVSNIIPTSLELRNVPNQISDVINTLEDMSISATDIIPMINVVDNDISRVMKQSDSIESDMMTMSDMVDNDTLREELLELDNKISELTHGRILDSDNINSFYVNGRVKQLDVLDKILSSVDDLIRDDILDKRHTLPVYVDSLAMINLEINKILDSNKSIDVKLMTYSTVADKISCPKCNTHLTKDVFESDIMMCNNEHTSNSSKLDILLKDRIDVESSISHCEEVLRNYDSVTALWKQTNLESIYGTTTGISIRKFIQQVISDIYNLPTLLDVRARKLEVIRLSELDNDTSKYNELLSKHNSLAVELSILKDKKLKLTNINNRLDRLNNTTRDVTRYLNQLNSVRKNSINKAYNESIDKLIANLKETLVVIAKKIDKYNHMMSEENNIREEMSKSNDRLTVLNVLIQELNPTTGLIADSIKSFLHRYINDVNRIIQSVWSYELEVLPYDINDLDTSITYRFPVKTLGNDNADDIADTSESMREIIALAFRIVSLKYMGLSQYPLMIDEFGRSMDEVHLIRSYDLLETIAVENDIQMIIIAHIKTCYNRFINSGISIISSMNLDDFK